MTALPPPRNEDIVLLRRTLIVMGGVALTIATWQLRQLLLLLFASILAAQMFAGLADLLRRRLHLPFAVALALAVILPLLGLTAVFGLFGTLMANQFAQLARQLPLAVEQGEAWLATSTAGREIIKAIGSYAPQVDTIVGIVQSGLANIGSGISQLVVVLVSGVYLAAQPRLYVGGLIAFATRLGARAADATLSAIHTALGAWLKAQAVSMAFVAIGTGAGLSLIGLPSAIAIGFVAGLCEFVPYLGVILVSLPATLIGFSISIETGILTMVTLVIVQQLQGNVVMPMAQGKLADLPPALTLFSLIAAALLLGPLGVILAVPLTVVGTVLFRRAMLSHERLKSTENTPDSLA
ncbi:MAG: AI-2E family transporter [Polymorphobacter sp.]|uniref:AI-2E family transporter n=1 Tax=Polymorphobacter sp. TaxID=1909290 RepID=UPI003A85E5B2